MKYFPKKKDPNHSLGHGDIWIKEEDQGEGQCGHEVGYSVGGGLNFLHETVRL